jgi:hypothetical protein
VTHFASLERGWLASIIGVSQKKSIFALEAIPEVTLNTIWKSLRAMVTPIVLSEHTILACNCDKIRVE